MQDNLISHAFDIGKKERNNKNKHNSCVLWFTGLSGSGKSTIANVVETHMFKSGLNTYILDGDNIRKGINQGLDFTETGRKENLRRIAEIAKLFVDAGIITLAAFVSPLKKDREMVKNIVGAKNFIEIFVDTSLEECEKRDVKGLYKKARAGEIKNFTGIDTPFQAPLKPDIHILTEKESIIEAAEKIITFANHKIKMNEYQ